MANYDLGTIGYSFEASGVEDAKKNISAVAYGLGDAAEAAAVFERAFQKAGKQAQAEAKMLSDINNALKSFINESIQAAQANKSATDSASVFSKVLGQQEAQTQKTATATQSLMADIYGYNNSVKSAESSANTFTAVLKKQEAQASATATAYQEFYRGITGQSGSATSNGASFSALDKQVESLRLKFDSVYVASKRYETAYRELNEAQRLGITITGGYTAALDALNKEYQEFQNGSTKSSNQFVDVNNKMEASRKGFTRFGLAAQQAGYQVGDFFVQVSSGTNPLIAFNQQFTQLVGFFGVYGAVIGAVSSIVGAGVVAWMAYKKANDEAAQAADRNRQRLKSLNEEVQNFLDAQKALNRGTNLDNIVSVEAIEKAEKAFENMKKSYEELATSFSSGGGDVVGGVISGWYLLTDKLGQKQQEVNKAAQNYANLLQKQDVSFQEQYRTAQQTLALKETEIKYGKESTEYQDLANTFARANYQLDLARNGILGDNAAQMMEAYIRTQQITQEADRTNQAFQNWSGSLGTVLAQFNQIMQGVGQARLTSQSLDVQINALQSGSTPAEANRLAQIEGIRSKYAKEIAEADSGSVAALEQRRDLEIDNINKLSQINKLTEQYNQNQRDNNKKSPVAGTASENLLTRLQKMASGTNEVAEAMAKYEQVIRQIQNLVTTGEITSAEGAGLKTGIFSSLFLDDTETLQAQMDAQLAILQDGLNKGIISQQQFNDASSQIDKAFREQKRSAWSGMFGDLASLMNTENKTLFNIGKAAAIAQATIDGYSAAIKAYDWGMRVGGPGVAGAFMAASIAKTGAMIASIASTNIGGKSASTSSVGTTATTVESTSSPQQVYIQGMSPSSLVSGQMISDFFDAFYKENNNRGAVFTVSKG